MKGLCFDFRQVWIDFFEQVSKAFPAYEFVNLGAFSQEIAHGRQALIALIENQQNFTSLLLLKLNDCAAWWACFREEGLRNFDILIDLINAC